MRFSSGRLKYVLIALLLILAAGVSRAQVTVDGSSANLIYDGIDVSSYQKDIDWSATAQDKNIKFVYVKATEGATYRSRHYQFNIENARQYGIHVGAYHFFRPSVSVEKQFRNFTSVVKKEEQDLIPLIDVEVRGTITPQALADSVLMFADMLERHYGCRPMIYTGSAFYNSYLSGRISGYPLFIARYSKVEPRLTGGAKWILWQFSEKGVIAGIDHVVDLCRFNKGCGLKDILMKGSKAHSRPRTQETVPQKPKKEQPTVVEKQLTDKEKEQLRKEREKAEKEERKLAEKRAAEEKKEAERLAKQKEKLRKLKEKEEKEAAKQEQKRRERAEKEAQKKAEKEAKLRKEQAEKEAKARAEQAKRDQKEREETLRKKELERQEAKKRQEQKTKTDKEAQKQAEKEAKLRQEQQAKAEKQKKEQEEMLRKQQEMKRAQEEAAKKASQKQSQNQKAANQGKRINQSSVDNDD